MNRTRRDGIVLFATRKNKSPSGSPYSSPLEDDGCGLLEVGAPMVQKSRKSALFVFLLIVLFSLLLNRELADVQAQQPQPVPSHPQASPQTTPPPNKKSNDKKSDDDQYEYFLLRVPKAKPGPPPEPGSQAWFDQLPPDPCVGTAASITRFCQQRVSSLI